MISQILTKFKYKDREVFSFPKSNFIIIYKKYDTALVVTKREFKLISEIRQRKKNSDIIYETAKEYFSEEEYNLSRYLKPGRQQLSVIVSIFKSQKRTIKIANEYAIQIVTSKYMEHFGYFTDSSMFKKVMSCSFNNIIGWNINIEQANTFYMKPLLLKASFIKDRINNRPVKIKTFITENLKYKGINIKGSVFKKVLSENVHTRLHFYSSGTMKIYSYNISAIKLTSGKDKVSGIISNINRCIIILKGLPVESVHKEFILSLRNNSLYKKDDKITGIKEKLLKATIYNKEI